MRCLTLKPPELGQARCLVLCCKRTQRPLPLLPRPALRWRWPILPCIAEYCAPSCALSRHAVPRPAPCRAMLCPNQRHLAPFAHRWRLLHPLPCGRPIKWTPSSSLLSLSQAGQPACWPSECQGDGFDVLHCMHRREGERGTIMALEHQNGLGNGGSSVNASRT